MSDTFLKVVKCILSLAIIVLSILCIVWIAKVYSNADDEPTNRIKYYYDENDKLIENSYDEGEFCFEHYQSFLDKGVFEDFDIRMKKIKKFSLGTIIIFSISFGITIINLTMLIVGLICELGAKFFMILIPICFILSLLSSILALIFFIILSVHYFKSNFDDFDEFSKCEYLNPYFDKDYDFVYVVKNNYLKYFIVYLIIFVLNIVDSVLGRILKKENS